MAEYQPGYDGLPVGGKGLPHSTAVQERTLSTAVQAPKRMASHSSGRRVVAASVLMSAAPHLVAGKRALGAGLRKRSYFLCVISMPLDTGDMVEFWDASEGSF